MSFDTPFYHIWKSYETMRECLKIAQKGISKNDVSLLKKTPFLGQSEKKSINQIKDIKVDIDDYVILSLWASFERFVIDYIEKQVSTPSSAFGRQLYEAISKNIEYWKIDEILDVLKVLIDPDLIGQAKQIKKYRDWVAHRNIKKKSPPNVVPERAYSVLAEIHEKLSAQEG